MIKLKLCYIFLSAGLKSDSVQKKVISQIRGLNDSGVECRGFFFTNDVNEVTVFDKNIILIPYPTTQKRFFNIIYQKKALLKFVKNYLIQNLKNDEYIYLRYPCVSYELYRIAKKFKNRIISEHQSKEIEEIKSLRNEHPISINVSKLISYFLYQFWPICNELMWSKPYSKWLLAKVAVTNEIGEYQAKNCNKVWVIPNGIETSNYNIRLSPQLEDKLKIIFLKGTSGNAPWNGIDRLVNSLDNYPNNKAIELYICGHIIEGEVPDRDYIKQTGYLNSEELDNLISNMHFGFSTLCLYRKQLNEAAVLKAREYFARGLPFVYGYTDPDLENLESAKKYSLKVSNDDSLINFDEVMRFVISVYSDPLYVQKMRNIAIDNLDWKAKMNQLKINIIQQIT